MRYDGTVEIVEAVKIPDGMGGYTQSVIVVGVFTAKICPIRIERRLRDYGIVSDRILRIVTRDSLPYDINYLRINGLQYKILEYLDYSKHKILTIEEVNNG